MMDALHEPEAVENDFTQIADTLGEAGARTLLTTKGISFNKLMEMSE